MSEAGGAWGKGGGGGGETLWLLHDSELLCIQTSLSFLIGQHIPVNSQCQFLILISVEYCELLDGDVQNKLIIGRWWRHYLKARDNYKIL